MIQKVAVINDLSGLGKCSLTAAIPVLSCLGVQACPVPTAILTNQTGYESFYMDDYTDKMIYYVEEWQKRRIAFDGIFTGFLANARQVSQVENFIRVFRRKETLLVVDPVMGDNGSIYSTYTSEMCHHIRRLAMGADVITPNLTEACILLDRELKTDICLDEAADMAELLMKKGPDQVVITGVPVEDQICNIVGDRGSVSYVSFHNEGGSYSGTGDLLASVVTAGLIRGTHSLTEIVRAAAAFISKALAEAKMDGTDRNDGIAFERHLHMLWEMLQ